MSEETIQKTVEVNKTLNLIDLNGSKKNFISEIHVKAKKPIDRYIVTIATQDDLDNNAIKFVNCDENGEFQNKFTINNGNKLINYYLIIKKKPDDNTFSPILCDIRVKLTEIEVSEIPPPPSQPQLSQPQLSQQQLSQPQLSQPQLSQPQLSQPQLSQPESILKRSDEKDELYRKYIEKKNDTNINYYYMISLFCFIFILYIFLTKK